MSVITGDTSGAARSGDGCDRHRQISTDADDSPSFTAGTYGSFTVGTDGSWSYVLDADDADTDSLDAGDNVTETFTVTASDGTTQTITLSITGSDDVSVITGDTSGAAKPATVTGALSISDVDAVTVTGPPRHLSITDGSWSDVLDADDADTDALDAGDNVTETFTVTAAHHPDGDVETTCRSRSATEAGAVTGALSISDVDADDCPARDLWQLHGRDSWSYDAAGDNVTETFTVTASDGTTQTITLSITGSDDVSVITGDTSGAATEAATDVTVTGALSISDVDADDSPSFTAATTAGTYGSFTVGTDGSWSYVLDADDADTGTGRR